MVVEYQQRLIPLRRLDSLVGWQWLEGDFTQQRVTWRSPEGKTLTLTLSKATDEHAQITLALYVVR